MNDNVKKWIDALRSGEFAQGKGHLRNERDNDVSEYCCLGVACELYRRETGDGEWKVLHSPTWPAFVIEGDQYPSNIGLPEAVQNWLSLSESAGRFKGAHDGKDMYLSDLNDKGASFQEIAKTIESEPEGLVLN